MQNLMLFSVVFVLAFVITAQFFWFLHYMSKEGNIFTVTKEGLPEQSQKINSVFAEMHLNETDRTSAQLLLEEIVMRMQEHTKQVVTARVKKFYGHASLYLSSSGEEYNPIEQNKQSQGEDHFRDLIFGANAMRLNYKRIGKRNVVIIKANN
ncbi:MAG: hypothetical protein J6Y75_02375 [Spirochaetaceae bacterium]|nr:hypothetical protein [Spirochaetaceae bacterium]